VTRRVDHAEFHIPRTIDHIYCRTMARGKCMVKCGGKISTTYFYENAAAVFTGSRTTTNNVIFYESSRVEHCSSCNKLFSIKKIKDAPYRTTFPKCYAIHGDDNAGDYNRRGLRLCLSCWMIEFNHERKARMVLETAKFIRKLKHESAQNQNRDGGTASRVSG
jgi:hypothetical protein